MNTSATQHQNLNYLPSPLISGLKCAEFWRRKGDRSGRRRAVCRDPLSVGRDFGQQQSGLRFDLGVRSRHARLRRLQAPRRRSAPYRRPPDFQASRRRGVLTNRISVQKVPLNGAFCSLRPALSSALSYNSTANTPKGQECRRA